MNRLRIFGAGVALLLVANCAAQADSPAPANQAVAFVTLLTDQKYQDASGQFDDQVKAALPVDKLQKVWQKIVGQYGAFKSTGQTRTAEINGYTVEYVETVFERGTLWVQIAYDGDGRIGGLHFLPKTP